MVATRLGTARILLTNRGYHLFTTDKNGVKVDNYSLPYRVISAVMSHGKFTPEVLWPEYRDLKGQLNTGIAGELAIGNGEMLALNIDIKAYVGLAHKLERQPARADVSFDEQYERLAAREKFVKSRQSNEQQARPGTARLLVGFEGYDLFITDLEGKQVKRVNVNHQTVTDVLGEFDFGVGNSWGWRLNDETKQWDCDTYGFATYKGEQFRLRSDIKAVAAHIAKLDARPAPPVVEELDLFAQFVAAREKAVKIAMLQTAALEEMVDVTNFGNADF